MKLKPRPRQIEFINNSLIALKEFGNTLGVAPTGSGKTIMLSKVIEKIGCYKTCVLAHRKELTEQNSSKFLKVTQGLTVSVVNAVEKDWSGDAVFAMVQTLSNQKTLMEMPKIDLLVVDETHHITAQSYLRIIKHARRLNPDLLLYGVTATPARGDKCNLGKIFTNCCDQITLSELIEDGHLVVPRTYVIDIVHDKLKQLKVKSTGDFNEQEVADILDNQPVLDEVIKHWKEKARDRKTVIFCSTIDHAAHTVEAFRRHGVIAELVTSKMSMQERENVLNNVTHGDTQVIVNVAILTEGWDFPPISCVILLRQSSYKSTMIQMIGRGLRAIDPTLYPNITKTDCVILDFGISVMLHGNIEQEVELSQKSATNKLTDTKQTCPKCDKINAIRAKICVFCGHDLIEVKEAAVKKDKQQFAFSSMKEVEILKDYSELTWVNLDESTIFTSGFNVWIYIQYQENIKKWVIMVGKTTKCGSIPVHRLFENVKEELNTEILHLDQTTTYRQAVRIAEKFVKKYEKFYAIKKSVKWKNELASVAQMKYLDKEFIKPNLTKGDATVLLTYKLDAINTLQNYGVI